MDKETIELTVEQNIKLRVVDPHLEDSAMPEITESEELGGLKLAIKLGELQIEEGDDANLTIADKSPRILSGHVDPLIGVSLAGLRIVDRIGAGGSSTVYLASRITPGHTQIKDACVAIKVLNVDLVADPVAVKGFQLEAELISSLNHPSIAAVFDFGVLPDGRPYLVMEYVSGLTLRDAIDRSGRLDITPAKIAFFSIIEALSYAHSQGILHRDIKPSNIIFDGSGNVKILDFGIARVTASENLSTVTRTNTAIGTPAYMSPEQCSGQKQDLRSDIYSLGCVMYECLSGRQVFPSNNAFNCMRQHTLMQPEPLHKVAPGIDKRLSDIVMKCLPKDPNQRFQSLEDLADQLNGTVSKAGEPEPTKVPKFAFFVSLLITITITIGTIACLISDRRELSKVEESSPELKPHRDTTRYAMPPVRTKTAKDFLLEQFSTIDSEIASLKMLGRSREAETMEKELQSFKAMWTDTYPYERFSTPIKANRSRCGEACIVEAFTDNESARKYDMTVRVTYTGRPVTLVLKHSDRVNWKIEKRDGASIARVEYVESPHQNGVHRSQLISAHNGISPIYGRDSWSKCSDSVKQQLHCNLVSVLYCNTNDGTVTIGPENMEWRAEFILSEMHEFYSNCMKEQRAKLEQDLKKISYEGVWVDRHRNSVEPEAVGIGSFNASGVLEKTKKTVNYPIFSGVKSPDGEWYLLAREGLLHCNAKNNEYVSLPTPEGFSDSVYFTGITYDTKRKQILVCALERADAANQVKRSLIYAYRPVKGWSKLKTVEHLELTGLAYSPTDDSLYSLAWDGALQGGWKSGSVIYRTPVAGKKGSITPTSEDMYEAVGPNPPAMSLKVFDNIIIASFDPNHTWLMDKLSGRVLKQTKHSYYDGSDAWEGL